MANNSRVTTIATQKGPDDSGVGEMLFQRAEEARKNDVAAKQFDVLEGIRSKYNQTELSKRFELDSRLEALKNQLTVERTNQAFANEQLLRQQNVQGLLGVAEGYANQGVPMPGVTEQIPEAQLGDPEFRASKRFGPGAQDALRLAVGENLRRAIQTDADRRKESHALQQKQLAEEFDILDPMEQRDVATLSMKFRALDDNVTASLLDTIRRKSVWKDFQTKVFSQLQLAQAKNATARAIAEEVTRRNTEIARIRAEATRMATKTRADHNEVFKLFNQVGAQISGIKRLHDQLYQTSLNETDPVKQMKIQKQMYALNEQSDHLLQVQSELQQRIANQPAAPPIAPPPGIEGPPVAPPVAPGLGRTPKEGLRSEFEQWRKRRGLDK